MSERDANSGATPPGGMMAMPVLDRGGVADRVRNHLRRRAITRLGLIEGDLYLLPFWRVTGRGPEGEVGFHLLAAEMGDPRLHRLNLLPANLKPYDATKVPEGAVSVRPEVSLEPARRRGAAIGWHAERFEQLVHYPIWMMRVEDSGRTEGAWIDGIEGRIIIHAIKVPAPLPGIKESAVATLPVALAMALSGFFDDVFARALWSASVLAVSTIVISRWLVSRARREREG